MNPCTIKLFIHKGERRVAFAESSGDFVDYLLGFLTLPMGTIVRLLSKDSSHDLGCMGNLLRSLDRLDTDRFTTPATRTMLLQPRFTAEHVPRCLSRAVDFTSGLGMFYACESVGGTTLGHPYPVPLGRFGNQKCQCGLPISVEVRNRRMDLDLYRDGVFVNTYLRYTITDGLLVDLSSTSRVIDLFDEMRFTGSELEEKEVKVNCQEFLHLLGNCLFSSSALTDTFLKNAKEEAALTHDTTKIAPRDSLSRGRSHAESEGSSAFIDKVKLLVDKNDHRVLHAEDENGCFVDLISSFLTFPLGAIVKLLSGETSVTCIDNLYRSTMCLGTCNCITSEARENMLLNPTLPASCLSHNVPICLPKNEDVPSHYLCKDCCHHRCNPELKDTAECSYYDHSRFVRAQEMKSTEETFLKNTNLVITDDLNVNEFSASSLLSYLSIDAGRPRSSRSVEEKFVKVGQKEALAILKACLTSRTPLSDVLLK